MELLRGRPRLWMGLSAILAAVCSYYFNLTGKMLLMVLSLIAFGVILAVTVLGKKRKFETCICLLLTVATFFAVMASGCRKYDGTLSNANSYNGETLNIVGEVTDVIYSSPYYSVYGVRLCEIDGEDADLSVELICEYDPVFMEERMISGEVKFESLTGEDLRLALGEGYYTSIISDRPDGVVDIGADPVDSVKDWLVYHNAMLSDALCSGLGGNAGNMTSAMLLGNKHLIPEEITRDCRRSGVSHLLALSGLHISIIFTIVDIFMRGFFITKQIRLVIEAPMIILFVIMVGAPVSAIRAAIMTIVMIMLPVFKYDYERIEDLGIAAAIVLIWDPYAVMTAAFRLSFAATLGIVSVMANALFVYMDETRVYLRKIRYIEKTKFRILSICRPIVKFLISSVLAILTANVATVMIVWTLFGEISLAAFSANMLLVPMTTVILYLSVAYLAFAATSLGDNIADVIRYLCDHFVTWCSDISHDRDYMISLNHEFVPYILIPFVVVLAIMVLGRVKSKFHFLIPITACALIFGVTFTAYNLSPAPVEAILVTDQKSDAVVIGLKGTAVIVEMGSGSYSNLRSSMEAARELGATEIESLVLTHYHTKHISAIYRLFENEIVRRIWMPYPEREADVYTLERIYEIAEYHGVEAVVYNVGQELDLFDGHKLKLLDMEKIERSVQPIVCWSLVKDEEVLLSYIGSSAWESESPLELSAHTIIFGSDGPKIKATADVGSYSAEKTYICDPDFLSYIFDPSSQSFEGLCASEVYVNFKRINLLPSG